MEHHNPHHWGYTSTPTTHHNTWTPPSTRSKLKRALSESDGDDIYSEESSKEHTSIGETDSCQLQSRKKRRGVIEKKRRDRINSSLSELKRLVPSAFEKQGSAKLEKAEILQLTVDHLKNLHAKGIDSIAFDPQRFAMDYHIIGFRECATEVARYLVTFEGMDIQDPLRLRLMSHLQCFVAQWEVKSNHSYQPTAGYHTPPSYQNYPTATSTSSNSYHYPTPPNPVTPIHLQHTASSTMTPDTTNAQHQQQQQQQQQQTGLLHGQQQQQQQHYATGHETTQQQQQQQALQHHADPNNPQEPTYTDLSSSVHTSRLSSVSLGYGNPQYPSSSAQTYGNEVPGSGYNNNGKQNPPYRPWGAEMAY